MDEVNVKLSDIFEYISSLGPIKEGEAVYKAGHVTLCGFKEDSTLCTLIGLCLQTSKLNGAPHLIEIVLNDEVQDWEGKCSCKAGSEGKCKHIVAVLLHANRAEELQKLSSTDLEQIRDTSESKKTGDSNQYNRAIKIADFCHPVVEREKLVPFGNSNEVLQQNVEILKGLGLLPLIMTNNKS